MDDDDVKCATILDENDAITTRETNRRIALAQNGGSADNNNNDGGGGAAVASSSSSSAAAAISPAAVKVEMKIGRVKRKYTKNRPPKAKPEARKQQQQTPGEKPKKRPPCIRRFQPRWTEAFGFVESDGRALCVFCQESVARKTYSVQRHYVALHSKYFVSEDEKVAAIERGVASLHSQQTISEQIRKEKEYATEASFALTMSIIERGKPFIEGEFIKSTFLACAETLFEDFDNKDDILKRISDIPASKSTIQRRTSELAADVLAQQTASLVACDVFGVAIEDTSGDTDVRRLTVFVRYVTGSSIHEGLCYQKVLEKSAGGADILSGFVQHLEQRGVDVSKVVAVTTDGSPALVAKPGGFVHLLQDRVRHALIGSPCILRTEDLCCHVANGELKLVMDTVVKTVNHLASRSSSQSQGQGKFQELLADVEHEVGELCARNAIHWLGAGRALDRFVRCLDDVRAHFGEKWQAYPELWNDFWLLKLHFLADLVAHLNDLNARLQRKGQTVDVLYEQWKLFTTKLGVFRRDIQLGAFRYFPHVRRFTATKGAAAAAASATAPVDIQVLDGCVAGLEHAFYDRFQDLHRFGSVFPFLVRPDEFVDVDVEPAFLAWLRADNLEMELLELKVSELWCSKFRELRRSLEDQDDKPERELAILECWNALPPNKFGSMKRLAVALLTAFGSTHCSEQAQLYLRHSVNRLRSRLTVENSETSARLKLTNYKPNIKKLIAEISAQGSH